MRRVYILLILFFLTSVLLFIAAFIYLDREKHRTYHYVVKVGGHEVGVIKLEKYITEDKQIYKETREFPFYPVLTTVKSRLALNRRYDLEDYIKELSVNGAAGITNLENRNNKVSFVSLFQSEFASLDNIPVKNYTFLFEEDSPLAYFPILDNYDFGIGGPQIFNVLVLFFTPYLPPMKRVLTLTSLKDEYLKIQGTPNPYDPRQIWRRLKTENLILKMRNYPEAYIWLAKSDKSLVRLEIPKIGLEIMRTFLPIKLEAKPYEPKSEDYVSKEVVFKNKKTQLSGTLTIPGTEGAHPAVLLVWGPGPEDREYQGFFTSMAHHLTKNGFCVLRFDKRGIGQSQGDSGNSTASDEIEDITAAIEFLRGQKEVDGKRIALVGHSLGSIRSAKAAYGQEGVRGLVMMAPLIATSTDYNTGFGRAKAIDKSLSANGGISALSVKWNADYIRMAMKSNVETTERVVSTKSNWALVSGVRCFLKKMRDDIDERPLEDVKQITSPVLILQGKEDDPVFIESSSLIDSELEVSGNMRHTLIYFDSLGHFFGRLVNDGVHKFHYEVDGAVLEKMTAWLKEAIKEPVPESALEAEVEGHDGIVHENSPTI